MDPYIPKAVWGFNGTERPGAMSEILSRLGTASINVRAMLSACAGGNRYGGLIWVAQADAEAAGRALGATALATHHV
jgi:hypothetical protein